jgi:hypothetical protein
MYEVFTEKLYKIFNENDREAMDLAVEAFSKKEESNYVKLLYIFLEITKEILISKQA